MSQTYKGSKHDFGNIQNLTMKGIRYSSFMRKYYLKINMMLLCILVQSKKRIVVLCCCTTCSLTLTEDDGSNYE
jgi:hypothetical protein